MRKIVGIVCIVAAGGALWWYTMGPGSHGRTMTPPVEIPEPGEPVDPIPGISVTLPVPGAEEAETATSGDARTETSPSMDAGEPTVVTVQATNYSFSPTTIRVKKGDTVRIDFVNETGTHDLVIDEFEVRTKRITGAGTDSVTFVADTAGSFEYYCAVGSHRQMGMVGTLIVE
jgi:plastocyanin